jgi:DNA-binding response OmpR family regulator
MAIFPAERNGHGPTDVPRRRRVLLVEEDADARTLLRSVLERHGLEVVESDDAAGGLRRLFDERPDLVVLDLHLPDLFGSALIARIRELTDVPVMVVTDRGNETAAVESLRVGADDFVTRPFAVAEMVARVEALLRRTTPADALSGRYVDDLIEVDFAALEVCARGRLVELTPQELRLLVAFVRHPGQVLSAEQLLRLAWNGDLLPRDRVKLYVGYLRRTFREHGVDLPVETVRGFGYRYRPPS